MGRFKHLVDSKEGMKSFRTKYNIPPNVGVRYVTQEEWFDERKTREVVIPMIAFIEGGMTIPMGTLTRNFLRFFKLSPTQCAPNMFRVLGSMEAFKWEDEPKLNPSQHELDIQSAQFEGAGVLPKVKVPWNKVDLVPPYIKQGIKGWLFDFFWVVARRFTLSS